MKDLYSVDLLFVFAAVSEREGERLGLEFSFSHLVTATDLIGNAEGC